MPWDQLLLLLKGINYKARLHLKQLQVLANDVLNVFIARDLPQPIFLDGLSDVRQRL